MVINMNTAGLIFYIIFAIAWMIFAGYTIIHHQADRKRKGWMWFSYLLGIGVLVYWILWIFSKKFRKKRKN